MLRPKALPGLILIACLALLPAGGIAYAQQNIQKSQSSTGAETEGGTSSGDNNAAFTGGASASGEQAAQSQQLGSNSGALRQKGASRSGASVAGSQVTGSVADETTIMNQNSSEEANAETGEAETDNEAEVFLGPFAEGDVAQATQIGDDEFDLGQVGAAASGDAVAGSQVSGVVGVTATLSHSNAADEPTSESGEAEATNDAVVELGAAASGVDVEQSEQEGDALAVVSQAADAASGDSVAGAQITGAIGAAHGSLTVQNQQSSDEATADTGDAESSNELDLAADELELAQTAAAATGDAVAGSQVTGGAGHGDATVQVQNSADEAEATTGDVTGETMNDADVAADVSVIDQRATAATGDAVAGSQVTGLVVEGGGALVQAANSGQEAEATSGDVEFDDAMNELDLVGEGDDNEATINQDAVASTGDAVAGSQVTGVVAAAAGLVVIDVINSAAEAEATTGSIDGASNVLTGHFGPVAEDPAQAMQLGDNVLELVQNFGIATGDAVAGGQVSGVARG